MSGAREKPAPVVTFLSDYGLEDVFVGVCHAVLAQACPTARIIDVTHGIARHDVRTGAITLSDCLPYLPVGVHLAVVDPEVGTERRAVAARLADGRILVGPDNGLLAPAIARAGGAEEAVEIGRSPFRLEPVSATFHGRDVFAPVTGALAGGVPLAAVGEPLDVTELAELHLPRAQRDGDALIAHVLLIDAFGNVRLDADHSDLAGSGLLLGRGVEVSIGGAPPRAVHFARTFADVEPGELMLYEDAHRALALAVNRGDARAELGLEQDAEVWLRPA
ncbi:MAG: SAM hydrolase/SAM-dependent halogenase family protein [Solirubrobacteraceae bacterium]